jgi:CheY-like chemotaxis protein
MSSTDLSKKFQQTEKCILAIDEDIVLLEMVKSCFHQVEGWQVLTTDCGHEGLSLAATANPSVILLDVMMQKMDGLILFQHLQSNAATQAIPVVLLTADIELINTYRYPTGGIVGAIAKPFEPHQLVNQVTQYLDCANH